MKISQLRLEIQFQFDQRLFLAKQPFICFMLLMMVFIIFCLIVYFCFTVILALSRPTLVCCCFGFYHRCRICLMWGFFIQYRFLVKELSWLHLTFLVSFCNTLFSNLTNIFQFKGRFCLVFKAIILLMLTWLQKGLLNIQAQSKLLWQ